MEELQAIKLLRHVLLGEKPLKLTTKPTLTTATQQSSPITPDLTYTSSDIDSDADIVDGCVDRGDCAVGTEVVA